MAKSPIESGQQQQQESQNPPELEAPLLQESIVEQDSSFLSSLRAKMAEGLIWHKVAALSGMAAIGMGTYGAHLFKPANPIYKDVIKPRRSSFSVSAFVDYGSAVQTCNYHVWQTANLYHLVHTTALLAAPITKRPHVFGGLLTFGIVAFSGSCYVTALYEDKSLSLPAPFGGFAFLGAWASLLL